MFCVAIAAVGFAQCCQLVAHNSEFAHVHRDETMAPEYNAFAEIWYQNIRYARRSQRRSWFTRASTSYTLDQPLANAPVMIYAHGGGGDRGRQGLVDGPESEAGVLPSPKKRSVFVSINYRLGADGAGGNVIQDFADATGVECTTTSPNLAVIRIEFS